MTADRDRSREERWRKSMAVDMTWCPDKRAVNNMLVGDLQRIIEYPKQGYATPQEVPASVLAAYERLVSAGYVSRLLRSRD